MKLLRYLLPLVVAVGISSTAYAQHKHETRYEEELNERDFDALRQFVNSKRTLDLQDKSSNLTISGDVRTEWRNLSEKACHTSVIANRYVTDDKGILYGRNDFDIEFNLRLDYICDNAWAVAHVLFDNSAGVDFGRCHGHKPEKKNVCKLKAGEVPHHHHHHHNEAIISPADEKEAVHDTILVIGGSPADGSILGCTSKVEEDPNGWQGSGSRNEVNLRKAYIGMNLYESDCARLDVELGRRNLYNVFDSKVQFLSRFDGLLFKYTDTCVCCMCDYYIYLAGFVVDERVNHFAWVTEIGLEDVCEMCLDLKFSFIDWNKNGRNRCNKRDPAAFRFRNTQFTAIWHFNPQYINTDAKIYGAIITNHDAAEIHYEGFNHFDHECKPKCFPPKNQQVVVTGPDGEIIPQCCFRKNLGYQRNAWYIGFTLGKVCEQGDWAFDFQYQWVEANSIPDRDVSGIGRGNFQGQSLTAEGRGNANYKGVSAEFLYAVTDNLSLDTIWEFSTQIKREIGGFHRYAKFELEAIYAF